MLLIDANPGKAAGAEIPAKNCVEKVGFFGDVTVPDDTFFLKGDNFTKTWRLRNFGTRFGIGASRQDVIYARIMVGWIGPNDSNGQAPGDGTGVPGAASCGEERNPAFEAEIVGLINASRWGGYYTVVFARP